jgi:allantoicase
MGGKPNEVGSLATRIGQSSSCTCPGCQRQLMLHESIRGAAGHLSHVVIDTANFKGNFPQSCELHAINSDSDIPPHPESHSPSSTCYPSSENGAPTAKGDEWTLVLPQVQLGPHREHYFQLESAGKSAFTHVRLTIFPDGGVKRVRVFGSKVPILGEEVALHDIEHAETGDRILGDMAVEEDHKGLRKIPALPLTPEAFSPYGQVIQSYRDITSAPRSVKITPANFGTATKYHKLSLLESSYRGDAGATTGISVYVCQPAEVAKNGTKREVLLKALERHPFTNQAFLPMSQDGDKVYLVVVGKNGPDDRPDIGTLRAFVARGNQGITYKTGIWRTQCPIYTSQAVLNSHADQPMTVLDGVRCSLRLPGWLLTFVCCFDCQPMDLACVETQIGNGEAADCEVIEVAGVIVQII